MKPTDSAMLFVAALGELDARSESMGQPRLKDLDISDSRRCAEVELRLNALLRDAAMTGDASLKLIEAIGAHVLALHMATWEKQQHRVDRADELIDGDAARVLAWVEAATE